MYSSLNGIKRSIILSTHHFTNTFVFFQKKIKSLPAVMDISFQFNIAYSQPLWILVYIYKQVDPYQHSLSLGQSESSLDERYLLLFIFQIINLAIFLCFLIIILALFAQTTKFYLFYLYHTIYNFFSDGMIDFVIIKWTLDYGVDTVTVTVIIINILIITVI